MNTIVIVGAGQAGGWAAVTLRSEGYAGRIVLIGDEPHPPYERPPLSKAVLAGTAPPESTHLIRAEKFAALDLDFRPGVRATCIDRNARAVQLSSGEFIEFDRLILATGGAARTLPVPGGDLPDVLTLRTLADTERLRPRLVTGARIVVVGGGWIGLEVAATARQAGAEVVVVEAMPRLCQRSVPPVLSDYLLQLHSDRGVDVRLGVGVQEITGAAGGAALLVVLSDGTEVPADTVVAGIGLTPNLDLAEGAGLDTHEGAGVVVGSDTRTSDPDIFAAGDVAVAENPWAGGLIRLESWQNAQEQGIAAAKAALGHEVAHEPLPWFWSDQYDVNLQLYGIARPEDTMVVRGAPESGSFLVFFLDGDKVRAAMGPNAGRDIRLTKRIIERGISVDPAALSDPAVALPKR